MMRKRLITYLPFILVIAIVSCSPQKFIKDGEYLLSDVQVSSDNSDSVKVGYLRSYVRQNPNSKWFSKWKVPLSIYSLSSSKSDKGINKFLRKIGEAPVVYDESLQIATENDFLRAMQNQGYFNANVSVNKKVKKKKISLDYHITPGQRYSIDSIFYDIPDRKIGQIVFADTMNSLLHNGMPFNINELNAERKRITQLLQDNGYYKFNHDYILYQADTCNRSMSSRVTLKILPYRNNGYVGEHKQFRIGEIQYLVHDTQHKSSALNDSTEYLNSKFYYNKRLPLRKKLIARTSSLIPDELYRESKIHSAYRRLGRLRALRYSNIRLVERNVPDSNSLLCQVNLNCNRPASVSFEVEGTNSAGDLGAAGTLSFQHLNLFRGSEVFTMKLRGAYEAITGLQGYSDENYVEFGAEASLNFPIFLIPFMSSAKRHSSSASSEIVLQYNTQNRPEFKRRVASMIWRYRWNSMQQKFSHKFDLLEVSYVYMPWISAKFKHDYIDSIGYSNAILKYNYEDLLITKLGYSFTYNSLGNRQNVGEYGLNATSVKFNVESSGNLLYGFSTLANAQRNSDGKYSVLNIAYAQYVKADLDVAKSIAIDTKNSLALHLAVGFAYPYGNSTILPYEKRYFSGGANSVRGWGVRQLGPGNYKGGNTNIDFLNQMGDIKLDASIEYRTFLFWKFCGAVFVDAGNIWTIRSYRETPGGEFRLNDFYRQIAVAYGVGLRLNLDYFVLRFDGGMKAVNPALGEKHYPILSPSFSRDFSFHFAVGLPF